MAAQSVKNRIVYKMLRQNVIGSHKITVETAVSNYLPSHQQGAGKDAIQEMLSEPTSPIEGYGGGSRGNIRLTSADDAVAYLDANDGDVPFGFD